MPRVAVTPTARCILRKRRMQSEQPVFVVCRGPAAIAPAAIGFGHDRILDQEAAVGPDNVAGKQVFQRLGAEVRHLGDDINPAVTVANVKRCLQRDVAPIPYRGDYDLVHGRSLDRYTLIGRRPTRPVVGHKVCE